MVHLRAVVRQVLLACACARSKIRRAGTGRLSAASRILAGALAWVLLVSGTAAAQAGLFVYVPNNFADTVGAWVTAADGTLTLLGNIAVGSGPQQVVLRGDQRFAYVTNFSSSTVSVIDTSSRAVIQTAGTGSGATGLLLRPDGRRLWVTNASSNSISVFDVDLATGLLTLPATTITGVTTGPRGLALTPDGTRLYVALGNSNQVRTIDTSTNVVGAPIAVGTSPTTLAMSPDGTRVLVPNTGSNNISVINTSTNTVSATLTPGGGVGVYKIVFSPDGSRYYLTTRTSGSIRVYNASTDTLIQSLPLLTGTEEGIAIAPDGAFVYVADFNNNFLWNLSIDSSTGMVAIITKQTTGAQPLLIGMCGPGMLSSGATFSLIAVPALGCLGSPPTFTGGTLSIDNAGLTIAPSFTLGTGGGTIATNGNDATFSGAFTGANALTKTGTGILTFSGSSNTYSGATTVNGGTLKAGAAGAFSTSSALTLGSSGTLDLNNFAQTIPSLAGSGTVTLGSATLTAGGANTTTTFSGGISGSGGLTKTGSGTLTLSGTNAYTGATTVSGGTLLVTGSTAAGTTITVASGATLGGSGMINGNVIVQPGGSIGSGVTIVGTITAAASSTSVTPSAATVTAGTSQTFTATVTSGGVAVTAGTVTFTDLTTATTLASGVALNSSGQAATSVVLAAGAHSIRATYTPDVAHTGSASTTSVTVTTDQTIAFGALGNRTFGDPPFVVGATASSGLTVTFSTLTPNVCAVSGSTVTIGAAGTCTIAADQAGDSIQGPATQVRQSFTVDKANQTITFAALGPKAAGAAPFSVSANASSRLAISFSSATTGVCTVAGGTVTIVGVGTCTIAANQAGDTNYNAASQVTQSFTVATACGGLSLTQLPAALVGTPYTQTITLGNAVAPITWTMTGTLPAGLTFSNGIIAGTPTVRGAFPISLTATDTSSCQASASYTLAVSAERRLLVGAGAGGGGATRAFNIGSASAALALDSGSQFAGGVSVAEADLDGKGVADAITGAGPGASPTVTVFDGGTGVPKLAFFALAPTFTGGVDVAAGDINGDGLPEILVTPGCGSGSTAVVRAFDGRTGALVKDYTLASITGCGLHVGAGDVNGDGVADLVVGSAGLGPAFVRIVDGSTSATIREFFPYSSAYTGGVYVAAGDVNGDGFADIVTGAGPGGTPHVRVFDGTSGTQITGALGSFLAYPSGFAGGVRVAAGDLNGDGRAEVITGAGPGGGPHVRVFDGATTSEIIGLFAFDPSFGGGVFVAAPVPSARMAIDIAARTTGTDVRVAGWALREIAADTNGNDAIHVWAVPVAGGNPVFVGAAPSRLARADVAAFFGGEFLMSGFDFTGTFAPGTYDLIVFARNSRTGRFDLARVVRITVP